MSEGRAPLRPRRIALLVSSMGRGGAERVAATLCNAWVAQGREVWLIATYLGAREVTFPLDERVRLRFLSDFSDSATRFRPGPLWKLVTLRRWLAREHPDVVVSFLPNVNVLAIAATRGLGLPLVVCERADPAAGVEMAWPLHLARFLLYPFASGVAVQTASAARRLRRRLLSCRNMFVVPNPLPRHLAAEPLTAQAPEEGGIVVAVGRLSPEKGFDLLLRAFREALPDAPRWRLEIWGEGPLREPLLGLVESLGLSGRAVLRGATDAPWAEMSRARIFALTSAYEGFPNAMLEAMALGLAAVSFDCHSGPRDITDEGRVGMLVAPGDVGAFALALRTLAGDRQLRESLGASGSAFVRATFSEEAVLSKWDSLFSSVETQFTSKRRDRVS